MTSEKQIAANRANAAKSTGPATEEGKNRSRLNARRHNLTGQVTTMTEEDRTAHDAFSKAIINDLAPEGAMETQLAQRIATDSWRLNRSSAIEDNLYALGEHKYGGALFPDNVQIDASLNAARVFTESSKQLQLLTLYEQRLNRSVHKNLAILKSLQAERKAQQDAAMKEAARLLQLSEMRGLPYDPAKDGFVFSTPEIQHKIDREQRLNRASGMDFSKYKPRKFQTQAA
jgi:hypothetical protein